MWHALLHFFSDLILFTAGTAVLLFWIGLAIVVAIEVHDIVVEYYFGKSEEEEEK